VVEFVRLGVALRRSFGDTVVVCISLSTCSQIAEILKSDKSEAAVARYFVVSFPVRRIRQATCFA
jgi:hypothetical protein